LQRGETMEKKLCPLCERHAKMHTTDGMSFWIEWGTDGKPRFYMDSTTSGGGVNVLCVNACPLCGSWVGQQEADQ
jgi:hypothetical protein